MDALADPSTFSEGIAHVLVFLLFFLDWKIGSKELPFLQFF